MSSSSLSTSPWCLAIGFYLRGRSNTGEDFFMAGREMTAWVAGLSFLSANLGALELMGWAGSAYQYGILATHWYWIGAIPAMLFLGAGDDAVLLHLQDPLGAGIFEAAFRRTQPRAVRGFVRLHDRADERRQHVRHGQGHADRAGLGHQFQHLGFVAHGRDLRDAGRTALRDLQRSAAVLSHLGGRAADSDSRLDTKPAAGRNLKIQIAARSSEQYVHLWSGLGSFTSNPMGIHWTGIVFGLGAVISMGYWTTDFLVVQRILAAKDIRSAEMAPIIGAGFKMMVPLIVILPGLLGLAVLPMKLVPESVAAATGGHSYNDVLPLMLARYCGPGSARPGNHGSDCGIHVRHGGQCQRIHHCLDL